MSSMWQKYVMVIFLLLPTLVLSIQLSQPLLSNEASDAEYIQYLSLCAEIDSTQITSEVLNNYRAAVHSINNGVTPPKVCWVAPGEAGDLGWSFQEFAASNVLNFCFKAEAEIRSSVTEEESVEVIREMIVVAGCRVLFPISFEFRNAISILSAEFPDVMFAAPVPIPETGVSENVRTFAINGYEAMYLLGYLSQLMDTSQDLGGVTSQYIVTELQGAATYLFGLQDAAAEEGVVAKKWHLWFTNSFSDVDRALFATQNLVERFGVDHVSQTVDPYEPQVWLRDNGHTGTGVIADMGLFVGETTIASQHVRWDIAGLNAYAMLLANGQGVTWGNDTPTFLPCNAWIGSITYGTFSSMVPADIQERVRQRFAFLQSSPFATSYLWCGERMLPLLPAGQSLDENGCMTFEQFFNISVVHPDIDHLGEYVIPLQEITLDESSIIGMSVIIAIGLFITGAMLLICIIFYQAAIIRLQSHILSWNVLIFAIIAQIGLILSIPTPNDELCRAAVFLYAIGLFGMLSVYATKTFFFYRMASNRSFQQIDHKQVLWVFIPTISIAFILVICYVSINNNGEKILTWEDTDELDIYEIRHVCDFSSSASTIILSIMVAYCGILTILVLVVCFKLADHAGIYKLWKDEVRYAWFASAFTILFLVLALVLSLTIEDMDAKQWVIFFCGFMIVFGNICSFYGPKVYTLLLKPDSPKNAPFAEYMHNAVTMRSHKQSSRGISSSLQNDSSIPSESSIVG